jgi:penicillin-binding protein 1A
VVNSGGEWFYDEYVKAAGVTSLGLDDKGAPASNNGAPVTPPPPQAEERNRILDLFRN